MTAVHLRPGQALTIADYVALPEDEVQHWELQEGGLVMSPSATPEHMTAISDLYGVLKAYIAHDLRVVPDVDLDLQLAPAHGPATVRRPDLVVVEQHEFERRRREGGVLRAEGAVLVVEIVSPGSQRTDTRIKRDEYADARIPHYWIIELDAPASLTACHLAGEFGYQDSGAQHGMIALTEPFPVTVELDALG